MKKTYWTEPKPNARQANHLPTDKKKNKSTSRGEKWAALAKCLGQGSPIPHSTVPPNVKLPRAAAISGTAVTYITVNINILYFYLAFNLLKNLALTGEIYLKEKEFLIYLKKCSTTKKARITCHNDTNTNDNLGFENHVSLILELSWWML